ncbi:M1 family metallopeptidase [Deinococcus cellulosilyticus]|uniref:Aminopeptidase N n=1 Tax=Deinococcus cellulosilyticus (strain DSM 18568 / NBRC 106333 / KACC 11606 / 5516J-15) TaxID=1223518 RepID=A0A511MZT8_DEIC1|nr:M1 family metallopeptidase [Deinococcus cellulosilyticus]GEM45758.1 peptidase [Deinococcus cellulosilyticus NBRC 106333 = KACC 11606]
MKRLLSLLLLLSPAAFAQDALFPAYGNEKLDVVRYDLDLRIDPVQNVLQGSAAVRVKLASGLREVDLDLSGRLSVSKVTVGGQEVAFSQSNDRLHIGPLKSLSREVTLNISYSGMPRGIADPSAPDWDLGWTQAGNSTYVVSEPVGSFTWFPVNDFVPDKALYTFKVTVPKPYVAVANGLLTETVNGTTETTYVWDNKKPMAAYLATVNVGQFELQQLQTSKGLPVLNYFAPGTSQKAKDTLALAPQIMDYFESLIGPYPFEAAGGLVVGPDLPFALENQTRPIYGSSIAELEFVVAHEIAHQWFGNSVTPKTWRDMWLNEGFSSYFHALWVNHSITRIDALEIDMRQAYRDVQQRRDGSLTIETPEELFGEGVYDRGAVALHVLRKQVGDEKFFRTIRTYYRRYMHKTAGIEDFLRIAKTVTGQGALIDTWSQQWIYQEALPPYPGQ